MSYGGGGYYGGGYQVGRYTGGDYDDDRAYDDRVYDGRGHHGGGRRGGDPYDRSQGRRSKEEPEYEKSYRETMEQAKNQRRLDEVVAKSVITILPP